MEHCAQPARAAVHGRGFVLSRQPNSEYTPTSSFGCDIDAAAGDASLIDSHTATCLLTAPPTEDQYADPQLGLNLPVRLSLDGSAALGAGTAGRAFTRSDHTYLHIDCLSPPPHPPSMPPPSTPPSPPSPPSPPPQG